MLEQGHKTWVLEKTSMMVIALTLWPLVTFLELNWEWRAQNTWHLLWIWWRLPWEGQKLVVKGESWKLGATPQRPRSPTFLLPKVAFARITASQTEETCSHLLEKSQKESFIGSKLASGWWPAVPNLDSDPEDLSCPRLLDVWPWWWRDVHPGITASLASCSISTLCRQASGVGMVSWASVRGGGISPRIPWS